MIKDCHKCDISIFRKNIVNGSGNANTEIMIIGEAPGYNEDKTGKPFVGKAGQYLDNSLSIVGLNRDWFYVTNVIKCKPLGLDKPSDTEIKNCFPYLLNELNIIKPRLILSLGTYSFSAICGQYRPITKWRGRLYKIGRYLVFPTFHPAYILRQPEQESIFLDDLKQFRYIYMKLK